MITATTDHKGKIAFETVARGVSYYLRSDTLGRYELSSRRLALGRSNIGSVRHFATLTEVETTVKAFAGLSDLINCPEIAS